MNAGNQLLIINQLDCNSTVQQLTTALKAAGYIILQSFDLHSAMAAHPGCGCDSDACACQMVVLLVYAQEGLPTTLICDSDGHQTMVYLVNNPQQSAQPGLMGSLSQLHPASLSTLNQTIPQVE